MKTLKAILTETKRGHLYDERTKEVKKLNDILSKNEIEIKMTNRGEVWNTAKGKMNLKVSSNGMSRTYYFKIISPRVILYAVEKLTASK